MLSPENKEGLLVFIAKAFVAVIAAICLVATASAIVDTTDDSETSVVPEVSEVSETPEIPETSEEAPDCWGDTPMDCVGTDYPIEDCEVYDPDGNCYYGSDTPDYPEPYWDEYPEDGQMPDCFGDTPMDCVDAWEYPEEYALPGELEAIEDILEAAQDYWSDRDYYGEYPDSYWEDGGYYNDCEVYDPDGNCYYGEYPEYDSDYDYPEPVWGSGWSDWDYPDYYLEDSAIVVVMVNVIAGSDTQSYWEDTDYPEPPYWDDADYYEEECSAVCDAYGCYCEEYPEYDSDYDYPEPPYWDPYWDDADYYEEECDRVCDAYGCYYPTPEMECEVYDYPEPVWDGDWPEVEPQNQMG